MIQIIAKKDGFRRAGIAHSENPKTYPDDHFDDEQMEALENEPNLVVVHLPDLPEPDEKEEAQARKILEKMTNKKLEQECAAMGIEIPANATKTVLVDLLLEKTAPGVEE